MALNPLATAADLDARNITVPPAVDEDAILASASAAVRDAAGCPILTTTSTVSIPVGDRWEQNLDLPGGPVTAVSSVVANGVTLVAGTDFFKVGNALWRPLGWLSSDTVPPWRPLEVVVTYTHGYATVPADIVDLVCALAAMSFAQSGSGYGQQSRLQSMKLGQLAKTFAHPAGESPSPLAIPDAVRENLRERFGTSVLTVSQRP